MVEDTWSGSTKGGGSCTTGASGWCTLIKSNLKSDTTSVTFIVDNVTHATFSYNSGDNHDPDSDSDGTSIILLSP